MIVIEDDFLHIFLSKCSKVTNSVTDLNDSSSYDNFRLFLKLIPIYHYFYGFVFSKEVAELAIAL